MSCNFISINAGGTKVTGTLISKILGTVFLILYSVSRRNKVQETVLQRVRSFVRKTFGDAQNRGNHIFNRFVNNLRAGVGKEYGEKDWMKYQKVIKGLDDLIIFVDHSYSVTMANEAYIAHIGKLKDNIIGISLSVLHNDEFFERELKANIDCGFLGKPAVFDCLCHDNESGFKSFHGLVYPLVYKNGEVTEVVCILKNSTRNKLAEISLRAEREELLSLFDSIGECMRVIDLHTYEVLYVNKKVGELFLKDPVGGQCFREFHHLSSPCLFCPKEALLKEPSIPCYNEYHNSPLKRDFMMVARNISWSDDRDVIFEFEFDITARKKTERALEEEKERLSITLASIAEGVIVTDGAGYVTMMNKVAEEITGWCISEARGKPSSDVFRSNDFRTQKTLPHPILLCLHNGKILTTRNTVLVSKKGVEKYLESSCAPIRDKDFHIVGAVLIFRDMTEQRKIDDELQKMEKLESLGILAGGIAHDFNNIMTGLVGNITLAKMALPAGCEACKILEEAEEEATRARELTHQLMRFSKDGAPMKKTTSIDALLRETVTFTLRGSNVRCEFAIDNGLPPVDIDTGQISQVINNLVLNAAQAMPDGGKIKASASAVFIEEWDVLPLTRGWYICLSIRDFGMGIHPEHLPRIFDPYFTTKKMGSGLGLATSYSSIKRHNGYIEVHSIVGQGSTFTIYLPASSSELSYGERKVDEMIQGVGRILLVDDDRSVLNVGAKLIGSLGYSVEIAEDGAKALNLYSHSKTAGTPFDVVILDLTIPGGMGGKECVRKLKSMDPNVRAIVSSGYSNDPIVLQFQDYGFSGAVVKPYKLTEISQEINRVLIGKIANNV
jgi:PAS domain S-box-containing protein